MAVNQDDVILDDFGRKVSFKTSVLFYFNALIIAVIPIWLYWRIHHIDVIDSAILFGVVSVVATYVISYAYRNTKFQIKHGLAQDREDGVRRELSGKLSNSKLSRNERDQRVLWRTNEVADYEATNYSIFYNNLLFLVFFLFASFVLLRSFTPSFNYVLSVGFSSGLIAFLASGSKRIGA